MRRITGVQELVAAEGEVLGTSAWHEVTQADVDAFAEVTGDRQWIHVDVERARATPFGGTIAHGYYTLALAPRLNAEIIAFDGFAYVLNYGLGRVRFPAALPVGRRVRASTRLTRVESVQGGVQATLEVTFEGEGIAKPVCVAETLARLYA